MQKVNLLLANSSDKWADYLFGLDRDWESGLRVAGTLALRNSIYGVKVFDQLRRVAVQLNTIVEFRRQFDSITHNVLAGLRWPNILVAGGSQLRCLTETETGGLYSSSDIDIFLYGLNVVKAKARLAEIETTMHHTPCEVMELFSGSSLQGTKLP
ncbi:hypothetical protein CF336_g9073 [Tilletia laevis]|nr:hypothetical protein CF336_g9073 [Tilletia laevis]